MEIENMTRDSNGKLPAYTSIGCYPLLYLSKRERTLCADCATVSVTDKDAFDPATDGDVYYEGAPIDCDDCGKDIESAYGDPESK